MQNRKAHGAIELILGILMIILGIHAFTSPDTSLGGIVAVYGILAILTGIADIVLYVKMERRTGFGPGLSLISGILSILAGILLLFNIEAGKWVFSILFPIWFIAHCISRLSNLGRTRLMAGNAAYWISMITSILGLVLGFLVLFNPFASAVTLVYVVGFYLILLGAASIAMGIGEIARKE